MQDGNADDREAQGWREFWEIVGAEAYRIWSEERRQAPAQESA